MIKQSNWHIIHNIMKEKTYQFLKQCQIYFFDLPSNGIECDAGGVEAAKIRSRRKNATNMCIPKAGKGEDRKEKNINT